MQIKPITAVKKANCKHALRLRRFETRLPILITSPTCLPARAPFFVSQHGLVCPFIQLEFGSLLVYLFGAISPFLNQAEETQDSTSTIATNLGAALDWCMSPFHATRRL